MVPGLGWKSLNGILGVDAALDGVPGQHDALLGELQLLAGGHLHLGAHQVHAGDHLGHGMLHLDAGVHLHEVEGGVLRIEQELDGARVVVAGPLGAGHRHLAHLLAHLRRHRRAGALLDELLVAPLDGAVALPQVHHVAVLVADELDLDVAGLGEVTLQVHAAVAEAGQGLGRGHGIELLQLVLVQGHAHAATAAAGGGLDDDRVAHGARGADGLVQGLDQAVGAGDGGDAGLLHGGLGRGLVAHGADGVRRGPDEGDAVLLAHLGELGVLREEAVARMDAVGVGQLGGRQDLLHVQVAQLGAGRTDADVLVGEVDVQGMGVGGGMHRHGLDAHLLAGADDPERYFAAVGDEDLLEHQPCIQLRSEVPSTPRTFSSKSSGLLALRRAVS